MDFTDHHDFYKEKGKHGNLDVSRFLKKLVMKRDIDEEYETFQRASPYWRIQQSESIPRIMVVHGTIDTLVPYDDGKKFFEELTKRREQDLENKQLTGVSIEDPFRNPVDVFVKLPETHHAFNFVISPRTLALSDAVVDFITHIYNERNTSKL